MRRQPLFPRTPVVQDCVRLKAAASAVAELYEWHTQEKLDRLLAAISEAVEEAGLANAQK
jgi:hypothetical protein